MLNPSDTDKGTAAQNAVRSDVCLYAEEQFDKIEQWLKKQKGDGLNSRHYQNMLLRIKKIREKYESGKN